MQKSLTSMWVISAFLCISVLVTFAYAPGIQGPALLDDQRSIAKVSQALLAGESAESIIFGDSSGLLGRPVSVASFYFEKLVFEDSLRNSKAINIGLHLVNGALVFLLFLQLFHLSPLHGKLILPILAAAFWMISPLFVSTVLYSVQRMAMLAAFFSLVSLNCYLLGRSQSARRGFAWIVFALLSGAVGALAKENALLVFPLLIALEIFWLQANNWSGIPGHLRARSGQAFAGAILLAAVCGLWLAINSVSSWYAGVDYSMSQRFLTQARVLWDYVAQFYIPQVDRMGIYHDDFALSTSLRYSDGTFRALLGWITVMLSIAALSFYQVGRRIAFGAIFFLLAHAMESSILPLELYYEHRNYLPAIGLALLPAVVLGVVSSSYPLLLKPLVAWIVIYASLLLGQLASQVAVWSSEPVLTLSSVVHHPLSQRARAALALQLAGLGQTEAALTQSLESYKASALTRAVPRQTEGDWIVRDMALICIASKKIDDAVMVRLKNLGPAARPISSARTMKILVDALNNGVCPGSWWHQVSDAMFDLYDPKAEAFKASADIYALLAGVDNALARYENAYWYNERQLQIQPSSIRAHLMKLQFTLATHRASEFVTARNALLEMRDRGLLGKEESRVLDLYTEVQL